MKTALYQMVLHRPFEPAVATGNANNNVITNANLPAHTVAVWSAIAVQAIPQVGSTGPLLGQSGVTVTIAGQGFGSAKGTVQLIGASGSTPATVSTWSDSAVTFSVPAIALGAYNVQLITAANTNANTVPFTVLTGPLIPVTFTVNNVPALTVGESVYLTGNVVELGANSTAVDATIGPLLQPPNANPTTTWFIDASVPAGTTIQFTFFKLSTSGTVTAMESAPHSYTVPTSGVPAVNVNWQ